MKTAQKHFWFNDSHMRPLPDRPIVVDGFAGGGGASTGIEMAIGRHVDVAINHDASAIAMHMQNHRQTKHYSENIWNLDPLDVCEDRKVDLAWFSPDCTHFSKARGCKPVKKKIRGLAWVVVQWAELVRPRIIMMENVEEFLTWGPVCRKTNQPIKEKSGFTFDIWIWKLRQLGYKVEYKILRACDFGSPTTRKRLFIIARCDGRPIVWAKPTHGSPKQIKTQLKKKGHSRLKKWKTAAEIIDWSIPCPSIFLSPEEAKQIGCKRPLAEKTMKRIAEGIRRYVIESPSSFIVSLQHGGSLRSVDQPFRTVTASRKDCNCLVTPTLMSYYGPKSGDNGHRGRSIDQPVPTQTVENRFALVSAFLSRMFGRSIGSALGSPVGSFTQCNKTAHVVATMVQTGYGERKGQSPRCLDLHQPFGTVVAGGCKHAQASVFLAKMNHGGKQTFSVGEPLRTITAQGTHHAEVRAFLMKYYGNGTNSHPVDQPLSTITTKDRLCLGIVLVAGEPYQIVDIGMRMLTPRELFRAQGFPSDYEIATGVNGKPATKTDQVARCGNSVCPQVVEALVKANL